MEEIEDQLRLLEAELGMCFPLHHKFDECHLFLGLQACSIPPQILHFLIHMVRSLTANMRVELLC